MRNKKRIALFAAVVVIAIFSAFMLTACGGLSPDETAAAAFNNASKAKSAQDVLEIKDLVIGVGASTAPSLAVKAGAKVTIDRTFTAEGMKAKVKVSNISAEITNGEGLLNMILGFIPGVQFGKDDIMHVVDNIGKLSLTVDVEYNKYGIENPENSEMCDYTLTAHVLGLDKVLTPALYEGENPPADTNPDNKIEYIDTKEVDKISKDVLPMLKALQTSAGIYKPFAGDEGTLDGDTYKVAQDGLKSFSDIIALGSAVINGIKDNKDLFEGEILGFETIGELLTAFLGTTDLNEILTKFLVMDKANIEAKLDLADKDAPILKSFSASQNAKVTLNKDVIVGILGKIDMGDLPLDIEGLLGSVLPGANDGVNITGTFLTSSSFVY